MVAIIIPAAGFIISSPPFWEASYMLLFRRDQAFQIREHLDLPQGLQAPRQRPRDWARELSVTTYHAQGGAVVPSSTSNQEEGAVGREGGLEMATVVSVETNDDEPACSICLEDFVDGDKVCKLACDHMVTLPPICDLQSLLDVIHPCLPCPALPLALRCLPAFVPAY